MSRDSYNSYLKRRMITLCLIMTFVLSLFTFGFIKIYEPWAAEKNTTVLNNGEMVILEASGPVSGILFTQDANVGAILINEFGQPVIKTVPGIRPKYHEAKAEMTSGKYMLVGEKSTLVFEGDNFISFKNPARESDDTWRAIICSILWFVAMASAAFNGYENGKD